MKNFAIMWQQKAFIDRENKTWMTLGLTRSGEMELPEVPVSDATHDAREKREKAVKVLAEIYGYQ